MINSTFLERRLYAMRQMLCCDSYMEMEQVVSMLAELVIPQYCPSVGRTCSSITAGIIEDAIKWRKLKELID